MIPINLKLKRKMHKDIAYAQDLIVEEIYNFFPKAVIHGGTAIWRCYNGNRFSEDIDVYIKKDREKIEEFFKTLEKEMGEKGNKENLIRMMLFCFPVCLPRPLLPLKMQSLTRIWNGHILKPLLLWRWRWRRKTLIPRAIRRM